MSLVTINKVGVINGTIMMPLSGVWTADLIVDQPDGEGFSAGTAVSIVAENGFTLNGTVVPDRTGDFLDAVHVRVVGGANGMGSQATPKSFATPGATVRDVANTLLADGSEKLSVTTDAGLLSTDLLAWTIMKGTVSSSVVSLLDQVSPTANWRILADGTFWMGVETWPSSSDAFDIVDHDPKERTYTLGVDAPSITPGVTLPNVGQVNRVEHTIESSKIRSHVWVTVDGAERGIKESINALIEHNTASFNYLGMYDAKVIAQSGDLTTVDVMPFDSRLPGLGRVPLRHGLPGCKVQVSSGAVIRLGWDDGDPRKPFCALWNGGESVQSVTLTADSVNLAGEGGDAVVTKKDLGTLYNALNNAVIVASDGGASLKTTTLAALALALWPASGDVTCASSKVKAVR